jgi:hypothetical protein
MRFKGGMSVCLLIDHRRNENAGEELNTPLLYIQELKIMK